MLMAWVTRSGNSPAVSRVTAPPHGVADEAEALKAQRFSGGNDVLHIEKGRVVDPWRPVVREPMARKIQGDEVQFRKQGRQAVEGVGVIEPAVKAQEGGPPSGFPQALAASEGRHIDGERFAETERRGGKGTSSHGGCPWVKAGAAWGGCAGRAGRSSLGRGWRRTCRPSQGAQAAALEVQKSPYFSRKPSIFFSTTSRPI